MTRYVLDDSTQRPNNSKVVIGGSPLRLFRLTRAGRRAFERIEDGDDVDPSTLSERLVDAGVIHPQPTAGPYTAADVTVVVPALNATPEMISGVVEGCPGVAAVIVVDDGSPEALAAVGGARVLRLRSNAGPAVARNAGLAAATTPLVAFVDTDVTLSPGWLDPLLAHFADEKVAMVAPRVASQPGPGRVAAYEATHSPLDLGEEPARVAPGTRVSYVPAATLVVRRDVMRAVGGFDRALRAGEDVDLVWRIVEAGHRVRYEPASVVHHAPRPNLERMLAQRVKYGYSAAALAKRHGAAALAPVRVSGWSAALWGLLIAGFPAAAAGVATGTVTAMVPQLRGVPVRDSAALVVRGHLAAGGALAAAGRRVWWPLLLLGAVFSKHVRRAAVLAAVPGLARGGPARLLDDAAYGLGVWQGALAHYDASVLRPAFSAWPPRRAAP